MTIYNPPPQGVSSSKSVPTNPQQGNTWNELSNSGDLVETWIWLNNRWVSGIKQIQLNSIGGSTSGIGSNFPLLTSKYDYLVKDWDVYLFLQRLTDSTNWVEPMLGIYRWTNTSVTPVIASRRFNNNPVGAITFTLQVDTILNVSNINNPALGLYINRSGTTSYQIGSILKYQLIRKNV